MLAFSAAADATAADHPWPQWRGPERDGEVRASTPEWGDSLAGLTATWSVTLNEGYSGPVVSAESVFTVETKDKESEIVRALDRRTGQERWQTEWEGSMKVPFFAAKNGSWARATPAIDGDSLYVAGMRDVLVCLSTGDGSVRWRVDFPSREGTPLPAFGFVSSPLVSGNAVYVQAGAAVTKLDKRTGNKVWEALRDERAMYGSAFSSPVIGNVSGRTQLVAQTRASLAGIDLESGSPLWETQVKAIRNMNILTPTLHRGSVFTATYGGGAFLFAVNRAGESAAGFTVSPKWQKPDIEGYMSSPVVSGDHAFLFGRDKRFHCLDLTSGAVKWTSKEEFGDYASVVINRDRVLALDERGELLLIAADPGGFRILDRKAVSDDSCYAHLAVAGDDLYVRSLKGLTAFRWRR